MPFTPISQSSVNFNAPITSKVFGFERDNEIYIKSVITDGAGSPQAVSTSTLTTSGNATINGNLAGNSGKWTGTIPIVYTGAGAGDVEFLDDCNFEGYHPNTSLEDFAPNTDEFVWGLSLALKVCKGQDVFNFAFLDD
jgi:hypothetical protein